MRESNESESTSMLIPLHLIAFYVQETGQKTAVKVVSKKKLSDEDYASLLMEIEILSQLDHPHIIR